MNAPEFPQYSEKTAVGLRGAADGAGGLAKFLEIEHIDVGRGVPARRASPYATI